MIPETGGVRKVRWGRKGAGKRGGVRVIYFYHDPDRPLYLLMVYAKGRQDDLDAGDRRAVRELAAAIKGKRQGVKGNVA
ncbi:MAG TPA: type II toxin-antitoxin system RelE/ParE family toxin [Rhizomicrobium sp.]|nr:type II toxin-antitoxin system RelE/ParE family toxin [Rhizomicrobium sp.]